MKKLEGFTLIETIISIFILSIIFTIITSLSAINFNLRKQMEYDYDIYEIQNFLTLSKATCRKEKVNGHIIINSKDEEMYFYHDGNGEKPFKKLKLSRNSDCLGKNINLYLDDNGRIKSGATISIKSDDHITEIIIGVGVDIIRIN